MWKCVCTWLHIFRDMPIFLIWLWNQLLDDYKALFCFSYACTVPVVLCSAGALSLTILIRVCWGGGSDNKESTCNAEDLGSIPGLRRSPGGGHGNPLQYSCLENPDGQRRLTGYSPWGRKGSDAAKHITHRSLTWISGPFVHVILSSTGFLIGMQCQK